MIIIIFNCIDYLKRCVSLATMHVALIKYLGEKLVFFEENYDENYEETVHTRRKKFPINLSD